MRRLAILVAGFVTVVGVPVATAPAAQAGQLEVLGVSVSWQDTMYRPSSGCSVFRFNYANNIGFRLLSIDFDILDPFSQRIDWDSAIGVNNGVRGSWDMQICSFQFTNGNGPYTFRLTIEDYDNSTRSTETSYMFSERPTIPGSPSGVSGKPGDGNVTVSWNPPSNRGGSTPITYTAVASPGGQSCTTVESTSCVVNGLQNGTSYTFSVTSTNVAGTSSPSLRSAAVTPVGPPLPPFGVAGRAGDTTATVSWSAPLTTGGAPISDYTVTASPGGATCTTSSTSCTVFGLENGTSYTFVVTARNSAGTSSPSSASVAVTPFGPPDPPSDVVIVAASGQITVSWTAPTANGGSPITGYTARALPGGRSCTTSGASCTIAGLTNGTNYTVEVRAANAAGSSVPAYSASSATPTGLPGAIRSLAARPTAGLVTVTWQAPRLSGGLPATYEYRIGNGDWTPAGGTRLMLRDLAPRKAVVISVRAVNTIGPGPVATVRVTPR